MADEYLFERTLTMMAEAQDIAVDATINPMLSVIEDLKDAEKDQGPETHSGLATDSTAQASTAQTAIAEDPAPSASPLRSATKELQRPRAATDQSEAASAEHSIDIGITIPTVGALPTLDLHESGDAIGGFELLGVIGAGGMGVVELARQNALRRDVVIKRPHSADADSGQLRALVKEGVLTGRLEHPNIVPIHFLGRTKNGLPALVMKRISGTSWRELFYDDDHPAWETLAKASSDRVEWHLKVLLQVCHAVDFAHSQGIIHRDIKLENVMLGHFGEVYLLDWGIGLKLDDANEADPGQFAGTPAYMAPEMLGLTLTPRTDVYLLGATLHELLTGTMRHEGDELGEVIFRARRSSPVEYGPEIPEELATICNKATHRDPAQRYPSVAAFREAIEEHLGHRNAIALVETAQSRLNKLKEQVGAGVAAIDTERRIALHELATECRFALREALKLWPTSPQARDDLQTCTLLMVQIELELGNLSSAELLLAELDELPPELTETLERLRAEQAQSLAAQQRLQDMERNQDARISSTRRAWLMAVLAIVTAATATTYTMITGHLIVTTTSGAFFTGAAIILISAIVVPFFREEVLKTAFNRRLTVLYFLGSIGVLCNRGLGFVMPVSVDVTFTIDMIVIGVGFAFAGATVEKRLYGAAVINAVFFTITLFKPRWAYSNMVLAFVLSVLWAAAVWRKLERAPQPQTQPSLSS